MNIIVAVDKCWGIGRDNNIPWNIENEIKYFRDITMKSNSSKKNVVVMGRNTWTSIPDKFKPLKNRYNIIVSSTLNEDNLKLQYSKNSENIFVVKSFDEVNELCLSKLKDDINEIFIIGGNKMYFEAINRKIIKKIFINQIDYDYNCTVHFPKDIFFNLINDIDYKELVSDTKYFNCKKINKKVKVIYNTYNLINNSFENNIIIKNTEEMNYLNLLNRILEEDKVGRETRNGKTFSCFGATLSFNIENSFPLLTTKRMFWKGIVEELLFFIKGDTNSNNLSKKKVKIWNPNTTREFLDSVKLEHYEQGDMGPMYGWQWRHFGSKYHGMNHNYKGQGFDQLKNVIRLIKNDPNSRRILMTTYNPTQVSESVLAPCHSLVLQFYVRDNKLSCHMYQRSADLFLGVPFNIASTSLLLSIIAYSTNLKPDKVIISFGDVHIYEQHIQQVKTQINRETYNFPQLKIKKEINDYNIDNIINYLENLQFEDFELINYKHHPSIKAKMVA